MDRTETCSGLSTRAFAICSMSSFIALQTQLVLCFLEWIFSKHLFPSETLLRPATDSIHTASSLQKGRRCAHRAEGLDARAKNCSLTLSERDAPCCGRLSREESGREFFGRHRSWAFWGWWMWFLVHFPDRHAKFWNIVAFPLAPVGFAQTCQHPLAFVLDRNHQVVFFCLIGRAFKKH